jgi:predicted RNA binding protein YcfA (HicA-like mRNA interferase family)
MVFAFHDGETIGPRMLAKVLKDAGIPFETLNREL